MRRVQLVAPTSTDARIRLAGEQTDGWLYLVTVAGTTGARDDLSPALAGLVERARAVTSAPLYAGFGISTPDQARAAAELADGVVVGSRALLAAEDGARRAARVRRLAPRRPRQDLANSHAALRRFSRSPRTDAPMATTPETGSTPPRTNPNRLLLAADEVDKLAEAA